MPCLSNGRQVYFIYMQEGRDNDEKKPAEGGEVWWQPALMMFGRLSGWVLGPVVAGALLGQWLDKKYGTEPWLFLASIGVAFIISIVGLVKNTLEEYRKLEKYKKDDKEKKENKENK